ncbi:hypothetical protein SSBR45G_16980 [Bradyrhizobium sp. SSBR45G]|nr:hypothetical protein SSBR45G_16980 [Bradyrhizobium sp. SSBR45G]GLH83548.1 hypothetical protein SSBR45R_10080 [Bradyrhizobium sp. SSBR45R]
MSTRHAARPFPRHTKTSRGAIAPEIIVIKTLVECRGRREGRASTEARGPPAEKLQAAGPTGGVALSVMDGFFAATALVRDLTLVTRNVKDFVATGARLFDPWTDG